MGIWELFLIAVGLSMDAFAVSLCKGLSVEKVCPKHVVTAGIYFGGFQMMMPLIGYILGSQFRDLIANIDHWIAFLLLGFVGANMIKEAFEKEEGELNSSFGLREMLPLAVATSIDALAVGVTLACFQFCLLGAQRLCCLESESNWETYLERGSSQKQRLPGGLF